mmetsp:Transcript_500/g.1336  ORF Transcript_500/g.1336 Transcript_500/m.1336 type:complete len:166 (+) Transcript_500:1-498(+)
MEAVCKSPYIEQNQMFCSGRNATKKFRPHWVQEELPWKHRFNHGIEAPRGVPEVRNAPSTQTDAMSSTLWMAATAMIASGALLVAQRQGLVERCAGLCALALRDRRELKIGAPYRAPRITGMQPMEYVAPPAPTAGAGARQSSTFAGERDEETVQFVAPGYDGGI